MVVSFDSLKTFYNILLQKLKNHRGNWNQNDPTADDYIKNRPFYSEEKLRVIVPEQTINGFAVMQEPIYAVLNPFSFEPVIGGVYKVMWDGEEYTVAFKFDEEFGLGCIGNKNYMQMMSGGDVPFAIIFTDNDIFVVTESTKTSHTISISTTQEVVKQIDPKYVPIPDDIATEAYVEELVGELGNSLGELGNSLVDVAFTGSYNDLSDTPNNLLTYSEQTLTDDDKIQARINIGAGTSNFDGDYNSLDNKPCYTEDVAGEQKFLKNTANGVFGVYPCYNDIGNLYYSYTLWDAISWDDIKLSDYCNFYVENTSSNTIWKDVNLPARKVSNPIIWTKYSQYEFIPETEVVFGNVSFITGKSEDNTGEQFVIFHFPENYGGAEVRSKTVMISSVGFNSGKYSKWYITSHNFITHKLDEKYLPDTVTSDVEELKTLVGDTAVSEQISAAVSNKADINHTHEDIALHDTVSGAESITIEHASSTEHEISVSLSSETYTDFSNITVVLTSDNGEQTSVASTDGNVTGLHSEPSFTLSLQCDTEGFDASQVSITCTYQLDLNRVLHDYVLHVDMDGEAGSDDVDERIFIDETLSITGAAADAKATGEAISNLNNTKVPVTRTINGKDLSEDIFLTVDDLGIDVSIDVSTDKTLSVEDAAADAKAVGEAISNLNNTKVPTTRTINGKDLSTDIIITAEDIGAITETDTTLTIEGVAADAKAVGEALENIKVETDNTLSIEGAAADAKATGEAITSLNNLVGTTPVSEQIAEAITEVYVQNDEPSDAPDGSIWVDLDADGALTTSGKVSANVYVVDAGTTDITTIDFSQYAIGDVVVVTAS